MSEVKTMNRRSFLKKLCLGLMGMGTIGFFSDVIGERFWLQIREVELKIRNLPDEFQGWKIVQFSDVHFGFHYGAEEFRRVVKIINDLNPDILFFTGDLVNSGSKWPSDAIPLLQELKASRGGKWAVVGNHDYVTRDNVMKSLMSSDFIVLINDRGFIESNHQRIYIAGLDDALYGRLNMSKALEGLSDQDCVLLLAHEPDLADSSCEYGVSAQFSGHSHGGQVRIPFVGSMFTPLMAKKYVDGLYFVGQSRMPVYVNRGIGTSQLPIRFFCRPEITVFHLS